LDALHLDLHRQIGECLIAAKCQPKICVLHFDLFCMSLQDKFQYLESNKLCTFSALFWLEFSSHYGDELCGLLDAYATLRRGLVSPRHLMVDFVLVVLTKRERNSCHPTAAKLQRQLT
jgi:hypothetical protein